MYGKTRQISAASGSERKLNGPLHSLPLAALTCAHISARRRLICYTP
jgi:hypothetical protein